MRKLLRTVRHLPDRLAHPRRRDSAGLIVHQIRPARIVFGCLGNICRSPYAAARLRAAGLPVEVDSAGFIGPGRPAPPEAQIVAAARGLDVSAHRSRLFRTDDLADGGLVVVMELGHAHRLRAEVGDGPAPIVLLGDFDPDPIDTRTIIDPFGRSLDSFESTFARIDRCIAVLIDRLAAVQPSLVPRAG